MILISITCTVLCITIFASSVSTAILKVYGSYRFLSSGLATGLSSIILASCSGSAAVLLIPAVIVIVRDWERVFVRVSAGCS